MRERPVLFSGEMVRAILSGAKTQTRRPVKPQPRICDGFAAPPKYDRTKAAMFGGGYPDHGRNVPCPFGVPGDRLFVRETWARLGGEYHYRATAHVHAVSQFKWRPSIHMPREASRLTLEITDVRVERLQAISRDDAIAEGCPSDFTDPKTAHDYAPRNWFSGAWNEIYGSWAANPWVWVVEFKPQPEKETQNEHAE